MHNVVSVVRFLFCVETVIFLREEKTISPLKGLNLNPLKEALVFLVLDGLQRFSAR